MKSLERPYWSRNPSRQILPPRFGRRKNDISIKICCQITAIPAISSPRHEQADIPHIGSRRTSLDVIAQRFE
jgi:hypothetical protein